MVRRGGPRGFAMGDQHRMNGAHSLMAPEPEYIHPVASMPLQDFVT